MSATFVVANVSGTRVGLTGSQAVQLVLLCGISGNAVVPLATMSDGTLLVSGPQ